MEATAQLLALPVEEDLEQTVEAALVGTVAAPSLHVLTYI